ncbi:hypothetical protein LMB75_07255 [Limosilactobacillus reuteri]|uniref:hypothetical protein n=1 Tax=Limosilactobacillus reuteri TaxID=1598 RepID=UPI001E3BAD26|nr:hypothetical protein [Limosilactobacillus reuteri]MCC4405891.1 hypothetical protein [Limosilactobacillus reuteri]
MKKPKFPKVKEYADSFFVDGKEIPYVVMKPDGDTTTNAKVFGDYVEVTVTFLARSYYLDPHKRVHGSFYKFKKKPWYKRLFSKLNKKLREHC